MKKILSMTLVLLLLALVGCTTPENKLPDLKEDTKVEMTPEEKATFLQSVVELTTTDTNNFRFDSFIDLEFAATSEMSFNMEGMSMENDMTITFDVDFDQTNYVSIADTVEDTFLYATYNTFEVDVFYSEYSAMSFDGQSELTDRESKANISLTDTFMLINSDYGYINLNGSAITEVKDNGQIVTGETTNETYADVKEKTLEGRLTQEMHQELMMMLEELQTSLTTSVGLDLTEAERDDLYDYLEKYVSIYSENNTHTLRINITSQMVNDLMDEVFESIESELPAEELEAFSQVKTAVLSALKSFDFDFRIILEGELEGEKAIKRMEFMVTGEFRGFTLDTADFNEESMPMVIELTVKLNKFGFNIDFDADSLELPAQAELDTFEVVEEPSFSNVFNIFF